jgi:hypothetical protein
MSKVDGNENNGNTLEEDPLMSNEDDDHHDLFEILLYSSIYIKEFKATLVFPPYLIIKVDKTLM